MATSDPRPGEKHVSRTREYFERLIGPLREAAREQGYAVAVHGSLERDIDLIAVPWTELCGEPVCLAEVILKKAREVIGDHVGPHPHESNFWFTAGCPGSKSHGRLCWSFHLGGGPYIDLSVMPKGK